MNNMKKFVGNVNGREFSDVEEFNKAVSDAVKSGEVPLIVSSYYKECDGCCGCEECNCSEKKKEIEKKDEKKPLDVSTILLTKESPKNNKGEYKIPSNVKELFDGASNIDEIKTELNNKISDSNKEISLCNLQTGNYKKKIDEYNSKIDSLKESKEDAENNVSYYKKLISIIDGDDVECVDKKKQYNNFNNNRKRLFTFRGFDDFLDEIGFWL